jgi:F-type H+-transporting ATPase subunit delta
MDSGKISTRYARALYRFAADRGDETRLWGEMKTLASKFAELPTLKKVLENPTVSAAEKELVLISAIGKDAGETCRKAIKLIVENDRTAKTQSIALVYDKVYREAKNMLRVNLTTVEPAGGEMEKELVSLVTDRITRSDTVSSKEKPTVDFDAATDESLIGGFVLQVGDRRLDASVKSQLNRLKLELIA